MDRLVVPFNLENVLDKWFANRAVLMAFYIRIMLRVGDDAIGGVCTDGAITPCAGHFHELGWIGGTSDLL